MLTCSKYSITLLLSLWLVSCGGGGSSAPVDNTADNTGGGNNDATLSELSLSVGTISPEFDAGILEYSLVITNASTSSTVTATTSDANASITVNGLAATSATATGGIALSPGANPISIQVTAEDGSTTLTYTVTVNRAPASFELVDPTAAAENKFGKNLVILPNGNIVVHSPNDSSVFTNNGAVHLFNPYTQSVVASYYGDNGEDKMGSGGIEVLSNGNFIIVSPSDTVGVVTNAGSVMLVNGTTGAVIGTPVIGDNDVDQIGISGVAVLANDNYVIASRLDNRGVGDAGSVMLMDGSTGAQIGATISGDVANDNLGIGGVGALPNNNFVVASSRDDVGGVVDAGSVTLVNGETAEVIATIAGDDADDSFGSGRTVVLNDTHIIVVAQFDNEGLSQVGSVMLVNASTGAIVNTITGDHVSDRLGSNGITVLATGNFLISSEDDDTDTVLDAGSVILVNGTSGAEISRIMGDDENDSFGFTSNVVKSVAALPDGNYVVANSEDQVGGNIRAGSVRLVNGTTGAVIGTPIQGDGANDMIGGGVLVLDNGNYLVVSSSDDRGLDNEGSVKLVDGSSGIMINEVVGDANNDNIGSSGVTILPNGNYVIASGFDDAPGVDTAGTVMLMDGVTGNQIGSTIAGDLADDRLGYDMRGVIALSNSNYVIISEVDNEPSIIDAGSMILVDGSTGVQLDKVTGATSNDFDLSAFTDDFVTESPLGDFFILSLGNADNVSGIDSGSVRLYTQ